MYEGILHTKLQENAYLCIVILWGDANKMMPKTPMGRIDGGDNLCYSHD